MSLDDLKSIQSDSSSGGGLSSPRKRSLSWLLPVGLLLGFVVIFALLFGSRLLPATGVRTAPVISLRAGESSQPGEKKVPENQVSPAGKGQLLFQASGWVEPDPYVVHVPTLIDGVVKEVHVLEGDFVKKGDLVATLIDEDVLLNLQTAGHNIENHQKKITAHCTGHEIIAAEIVAARRKVEAFQALLDEARDISSRMDKLSDEGSVSKQQVVGARLAVERQVARLAEAQAELPRLEGEKTKLEAEEEAMNSQLDILKTALARAQLEVDRTKITSPMDGIVLRLHAAPGKKRMLGMDDPTSATIVELYDPEKLQARIDVPLNEAAALATGQAVELVSDLLPDRVFEGVVTRITGQADLQRNTLQAKVEIKAPDVRLRPDMLVRAMFFGSAHPGKTSSATPGRLSLYVPEEALVGETGVWTISPKMRAEKRVIKLGKEVRDGHRLVLEGLLSGEPVILPPHDQLEEGSRVKVQNEQP